jgi:hypothetical protein
MAKRRQLLILLTIGMAIACTGVVPAPSFDLLLVSWFTLRLVALIPALLPSVLAAGGSILL